MNSEMPFIHLFKTPGGYYIFDVNTNAIIKTNEQLYDFLQSGQPDCDDDDLNDAIKKLKASGYLSSKRVEQITHPYDETLEYHLKNKLKTVILQVTQQCNLRCEYCVYSGSYLNRKHNNLKMSFETAKKGINFLMRNSRDMDNVHITFYGGEPLLEFELIKKCIQYAQTVSEGKTVSYTFTTNGTLFTKEIIEFFMQYDTNIAISLDGPKEVNDRNRKFAVSGCGTFETISRNLAFFKENYPEYFKEKVLFNTVLDKNADFNCVNEFFANYDTVKDTMINVSAISTNYAKFEQHNSEEYDAQIKYELFKLYLNKVNRLDEQYISKLVEAAYKQMRQQLFEERARMKELPQKAHHSGPCVPGAERLFVDVSGNLYPCERVSENSEMMKIGHIDTGFDIEKVRTLLNVGRITEESCKNCWVFRFCTLCAAAADNTKELSAKIKHSNCVAVKNAQSQTLKDYCVLKEFGHDFDHKIKYVLMGA